MRNPEVIYFEGLPNSGKTTLIKQIITSYPGALMSVDEYIHPGKDKESNFESQRFFMENDEMKYRLARESGRRCLVDRGHLSTVLYTHAYNRIRGDLDLSYVDEWYFGKILKDNMLPDLYILLDISPQTSLRRKRGPVDWNNMWDHIAALDFARENYPRYMGLYEPEVPVITLSSDSMTIPELRREIANLLGMDIRYHGHMNI